MATYKVLQDIEAEDKLLGPLSLKQFIFAGIAVGCAYICFLLLVRGLAFLCIIFLPPMIVSGFLAWPWIQDQPTEVWLLAKIRFHIKPRRRIWNQSGISEMVQITAPPREDKNYTDGLSEGEVRSRLKALASTIDSRGWVIKNSNVNMFTQPGLANPQSDRLIDVSAMPQEINESIVSAADDILDEHNNPTAKNLDRMINASSGAHKQNLLKRLAQPPAAEPGAPGQRDATDYWFLNQASGPIPAGQAVFDAGVTVRPDDNYPPAALPSAVRSPGPAAYSNMHTVHPLGDEPAISLPAPAPSPKTPDPAILELASNDDLNVATIARQANKSKSSGLDDGEVVVPLR